MNKLLVVVLLIVNTQISFAQFNKQWLVGVGGQFDKYNLTIKNLPIPNGQNAINRSVTNFSIGAEIGYFVYNNLSVSYKLVYQNWDIDVEKTTSFLNGIHIEKIIPIQEHIYLNIGVMPFYEKINENKYYYTANRETNNHGGIFTAGFSFIIDKNIILGTHLFRKFNNYPDPINGLSSLGGFSISVKYIFKNNLFKTSK